MQCPRCQQDAPHDAQFCPECGAKLVPICPRCGTTNLLGHKFCKQCGQPLATFPHEAAKGPREEPTAEAERRQLTVMFCDLVGSTALAEELDPEDTREIVRAYQEACSQVIGRFDGHIAQYLGDGLLVYFGYPRAHEDDAPRAVRAALGIVRAMEELNARSQEERRPRLAVRVGIHTGLVVVGEMGAGARQERLALGETPNLAARLQALAEPDTVVISDTTYSLVQGLFTYQDLGARSLKGVSNPVHVYRVLAEGAAKSRLEVAASRGFTPLVGREQEVELLLSRWEHAKDGLGQVVLLNGDAGIGKSRLVEVLKERVAQESLTRWECRCSPYYHDSALYPVIELFQRALQFERDEPPEHKIQKIESGLMRYGLSHPDTIALWAVLLSVPLADRYPPLSLTPQRQRQKTLEAILALLLALAAQQPVLLIMEDLHWVDPSTLDLLALILEQVPAASILLLLTFRPDFRPPWPSRPHFTHLTVNRFTPKQAEQMVGRVAGGKGLPAEVLQQVLSKTDGVPLFVEELTKMVLESGLLREQDDRYELTGPLPPLAIPTTLQDSLMARLDRLATVKEVAQLGATLGRSFTYELLKTVASLDEDALRAALARLTEAELVYQRGVPPEATYIFKHALIQEAAYQSLLKSRRQQLHARIAAMLTERLPEIADTQPELFAHHYAEAGLAAQAIHYWKRAGQRAIERSANAEAIGHLAKALEILKNLPETQDRVRQELDLQTSLGPPLMVARGIAAPEVEQAYARALQLSRQLADDRLTFTATEGLWSVCLLRAELQRALELAERCWALAECSSVEALRLEAHSAFGQTLFYRGDFVAAREHLEAGIALYDVTQHRSHALVHGEDPGVGCRLHAAWALWSLGYPDRALIIGQDALTLAETLTHPTTRAYALGFLSLIHQLRGETRDAQDRAEAMLALATENAMPFWLAMATVRHGAALGDQGHGWDGIVEMQKGLAAWRDTGAQLETTYRLALIADMYVKGNQPEEALRVLEEALVVAGETGERFWEAELYRLRGEVFLALSPNNQSNADTAFHQAIDIAQRQQVKSLELRAVTSLSRHWQAQGKREEARRILANVHGWFTEGFDTADLKDARILLDQLS